MMSVQTLPIDITRQARRYANTTVIAVSLALLAVFYFGSRWFQGNAEYLCQQQSGSTQEGCSTFGETVFGWTAYPLAAMVITVSLLMLRQVFCSAQYQSGNPVYISRLEFIVRRIFGVIAGAALLTAVAATIVANFAVGTSAPRIEQDSACAVPNEVLISGNHCLAPLPADLTAETHDSPMLG